LNFIKKSLVNKLKIQMKTEIKKLEKSEVEIVGILPWADFAKYEDKALSALADKIELPGFRKGKVPSSMVKEKVDPMMVLEEKPENPDIPVYPENPDEEEKPLYPDGP
jgi:hypothetical protein